MTWQSILLDLAKSVAGATRISYIKGYFTKAGQEKYSQRQQAQQQEDSARQQEEPDRTKNIENLCFVIFFSSLVYSSLVLFVEPNTPKRIIHGGTALGISSAILAVTPKKKKVPTNKGN